MTKDEAMAYGETDEGLTSIEETCDAIDVLKARVRELEAQREQDIEAAFKAGVIQWRGQPLDVDGMWNRFKTSRKGGSE